MKPTLRSYLVSIMLLCLGCAFILLSAKVRVEAGRILRVAVMIDASQRGVVRNELYKAFAASLGAELSQRSRVPIGVRVVWVDPRRAATDLEAGVYDAAFVMSRTVPDVMRKLEFATLRVATKLDHRDRSLYLIMRDTDATLKNIAQGGLFPRRRRSTFSECTRSRE